MTYSFRRSFVKLFATLLPLGLVCLPTMAFALDADGDGVPDEMDAFPCDTGPTGVVYAPGKGVHATMFFEDQWPSRGDNDFNDLVLTYNYWMTTNAQGQVYQIHATYNARAIGGVFDNGLALHLPVPASSVKSITKRISAAGALQQLSAQPSDSDLVVRLSPNVRELFQGQAGTINSDPSRPVQVGQPMEIVIEFTQPITLNTAAAPFDLFIFRSQDPTYEIHRPEFPGTAIMNQALFHSQDDGSTSSRHFVDRTGLPYVLMVPASAPWPQEGVAIANLYPQIVQFASSGGSDWTDYYMMPATSYAFTRGSNGASVPPAAFALLAEAPANRLCVRPWAGTVEYGTEANEEVWGMATDSQGNFVVVGDTSGTFPGQTNKGSMDFFIAKYDRLGNLLWVVQDGGEYPDYPWGGVAIDKSGNIYTAGHSNSPTLFGQPVPASGFHTWIAKYDSNGNRLWGRYWASTGNEMTNGIALDSTGAPYLVGQAWNQVRVEGGAVNNFNSGYAMFVSKLDTNGNTTWTRMYHDPVGTFCAVPQGSAIAVDSANYVYVGCYTNNGSTVNSNLVRFAPNGMQEWARIENSTYNAISAVATNGQSALMMGYAQGNFNGNQTMNGSMDAFMVQYNSDGVRQWTRLIGSNNDESIHTVATRGAAGVYYVSGSTAGALVSGQPNFGGIDYFVAQVNASDGSVQWLNQYGTAATDYVEGIGFDGDSHVWVSGITTGTFTGMTPVAAGWQYFAVRHNATTGALENP